MANLMKSNAANGNGFGGRSMTAFGWVDDLLNNTFNQFFEGSAQPANRMWASPAVPSVPVNIRETASSYEMELIAPGLQKEDFSVRLDEQQLTVSFESKEAQQKEGEGWLRREYRLQNFSRSFRLNDSVDTTKIAARYTDGVLHLSLPKKQEVQQLSKTINIE